MAQVDSLKFAVEQNVYGVCERLGEKLQMPAKEIRLFFIYASCLTVGSPVIVYLVLAFWMKMRQYVHAQRNPIWDF